MRPLFGRSPGGGGGAVFGRCNAPLGGDGGAVFGRGNAPLGGGGGAVLGRSNAPPSGGEGADCGAGVSDDGGGSEGSTAPCGSMCNWTVSLVEGCSSKSARSGCSAPPGANVRSSVELWSDAALARWLRNTPTSRSISCRALRRAQRFLSFSIS
eukprot:110758-Prymnesium_polylepis.1